MNIKDCLYREAFDLLKRAQELLKSAKIKHEQAGEIIRNITIVRNKFTNRKEFCLNGIPITVAWTQEAEEDLKEAHNLNIEKEIDNILLRQLDDINVSLSLEEKNEIIRLFHEEVKNGLS